MKIDIKNKSGLILVTEPQPDYELIDTGDGRKLERFGSVVLSRPDPQALWRPAFSMAESLWKKADAVFDVGDGRTGSWKKNNKNMPESWTVDYAGLKLSIKPTPFKHTGLFPEQESQWKWMQTKVKQAKIVVNKKNENATNLKPSVLNLFGYTGGASLACAQAGADVTHVDASKAAITWAKENASLSNVSTIRWMLDDALDFVKKEIKRGKKYDGIVMDPPAFGRSPKGKTWKIEKQLPELLELSFKLLSDQPIFFLLNGYAAGYSALAYENSLSDQVSKNSQNGLQFQGGTIESGELAICDRAGRLLSCGIFARWSK
ncbi:MAG: class I SAM-dependent methyltransferase [Candidatus Pacebacteria bacterium]|nr:class I SAM-dependent methyltransferase [Candidatus Paceibacterota bacterium]